MAAGLGILGVLLYAGVIIAGIASLVCFVLVVVKMFQNEQTGLGIACIALAFCTGLGMPIAFIFGWVKSKEWDLKKVMVIWSVTWALQIVLIFGAMAAMFGAAASTAQDLQDSGAFDDMEFTIDEGDLEFDFDAPDIEMPEGIQLDLDAEPAPPSEE